MAAARPAITESGGDQNGGQNGEQLGQHDGSGSGKTPMLAGREGRRQSAGSEALAVALSARLACARLASQTAPTYPALLICVHT